ncbi:NUDIX hydrolase [Candidatus Obscuribacterales bacterium]|nr:NUDIX hydrolase [Candidatus Obscuribacterales bacterium]MBX3136031.1 NUDIX hydrolase [Candidatus Obscuribacterales bacterium]MBX3148811.1 NUDIX hydrolase [Candidatus Obscuribacterales bacterium]
MPKRRFTPKKTIPTTRVSVVVVNKENKILLVRHKKGNQRYWVLPGGRLEYGETFEECAIRELKEETGLDVEVERFLFLSEALAPDRSRHIVNIFIKAKVVGGTMKLGDEPVLAGVDFLPLEDLAKLTLFPPVSDEILEALSAGSSKGIRYLGNLWV